MQHQTDGVGLQGQYRMWGTTSRPYSVDEPPIHGDTWFSLWSATCLPLKHVLVHEGGLLSTGDTLHHPLLQLLMPSSMVQQHSANINPLSR